MNKKNQSIVYIASGIFLPIMFFLIIDWYDVKISHIPFSDSILWGIWFLLSAPLILTGIYKLTNKKNSFYFIICFLNRINFICSRSY
jgi:hypothetical protein